MPRRHITIPSIYQRIDQNGNKRYYGSFYHNRNRIRRFLGCSKQSASAALKKLEYEILFGSNGSQQANSSVSFEKALLSFLKGIERTNINYKQVKIIRTKHKDN